MADRDVKRSAHDAALHMIRTALIEKKMTQAQLADAAAMGT